MYREVNGRPKKRNRKYRIYGIIAALAVVIVFVIVLAVSCGSKKEEAEIETSENGAYTEDQNTADSTEGEITASTEIATTETPTTEEATTEAITTEGITEEEETEATHDIPDLEGLEFPFTTMSFDWGEGGTGMTIMNDQMDKDKFYQFLLAAMKNVYESIADGGALYVFHSDAEKVNFFNATVDAGFHYSTTCIWVKNSLVLGRMDYQMQHEPVIYAFKDTAKHKFYGDRKQTTIWNFDRPTKSKLHPTMKPLPLVAYPMRNSSQVNGLVLDLFGGSGSTLMAADQLDRIAFLMELDPKYASAIIRRYVASHGSTAGITVLRNGETHDCDEFYIPTEEELSYKDGSVNDAQKGKKGGDA